MTVTQLRGNSQQPNSPSPLRGERWFEVEVKIENQRPMRQLVKATSKREAFEITYKRYNTVTCDHDGAPNSQNQQPSDASRRRRSAPAQVQVIDAAQRRLMPRPANRQRRAAVAPPVAPPTTGPGLRGKTAFGNLQTGF